MDVSCTRMENKQRFFNSDVFSISRVCIGLDFLVFQFWDSNRRERERKRGIQNHLSNCRKLQRHGIGVFWEVSSRERGRREKGETPGFFFF